MKYNFRFTPEDYTLQWTAARFAGRTELAKRLLAAAQGTFSETLDVKILEALDLDWENRLIPSEENLRLWDEIKRASKKESHRCLSPHPCRICCKQAFALMDIAFQIEAYEDAIEQADTLLKLNADDDIIALLLRAEARLNLDFTGTEEDRGVASTTR